MIESVKCDICLCKASYLIIYSVLFKAAREHKRRQLLFDGLNEVFELIVERERRKKNIIKSWPLIFYSSCAIPLIF